LSVFDGRDAVGHVVAWENGQYEAYLVTDISLGFFAAREEAVAAVADTPVPTQPHVLAGGRHG
jgi:hypothetical protein